MNRIAISLLVALSGLANAQQTAPNHPEFKHAESLNSVKHTIMEKQAMQVVSDFLTAVQQHNGATMTALLHPDLSWNQPGKNRFAGRKSSRAEVFQMVGGMQEIAAKTLTLTQVKTLAVNGNQVACLIHWQAVQPNGGILDVDNIDVYTVQDGQIISALILSADLTQEDNFWLN